MAYQQMENLGESGQERQISIFTTANLVGAGVGAALFYLLLGLVAHGDLFSPGWWVRIVGAILGIFLGGIMTMQTEGIPLYNRILLIAKYRIRSAVGEHVIAPERAVAARSQPIRGVVTIYRDGQPVLRPYRADDENAEVSNA